MLTRRGLELGDRDTATSALEELSANDFAGVPRDIGYLGALASAAVLAIQLGNTPAARRLAQRPCLGALAHEHRVERVHARPEQR